MSTALNKSQLLDVMQITNANFPIGTFSHSFGVETYIRKGMAETPDELEKVIVAYLYEVFMTADLLAIKEIYRILDDDPEDLDTVFALDEVIANQSMAKESRDGAKRIGTQMVKIYLELYPDCEYLKAYQKKIKEKVCYGNPAVAFTLLGYYLGLSLSDAIYTHMYSSITALIQNSVRAIPLGQVAGQKLMFKVKHTYFDDVYDKVMKANFEKDFCKNNPAYETAQMEHEAIHVRLFMS
ncbi:urease accessory protein UreF [Ureaplasma ceti]